MSRFLPAEASAARTKANARPKVYLAPVSRGAHTRGTGAAAGVLPINAEVEPVRISGTFLKIQTRPTRPGDADFDYDLTLSDAVVILGHLFLGEKGLQCKPAADFDENGRLDIADPIRILSHLFRAGPAPPEREVYCGSK